MELKEAIEVVAKERVVVREQKVKKAQEQIVKMLEGKEGTIAKMRSDVSLLQIGLCYIPARFFFYQCFGSRLLSTLRSNRLHTRTLHLLSMSLNPPRSLYLGRSLSLSVDCSLSLWIAGSGSLSLSLSLSLDTLISP